MPTILGQAYSPDYVGIPTQMSTLDLGIWERWRARHRSQWRRLYFDVHLGDGRPIPPGADESSARSWLLSTQKRADVLAVTDTDQWLIELRSDAQLNAIGRLLGYVQFLTADNVLGLPIRPFLVTDNEDRDVRAVAEAQGITYEVVSTIRRA